MADIAIGWSTSLAGVKCKDGCWIPWRCLGAALVFWGGFYGDAKESIRHTLWHAWAREWSEVALDVQDVLVKLSGVSLVLFVSISSEGA